MSLKRAVLCLTVLVSVILSGSVWARQSGRTGLPLPRFVSLRSDEANLRTGPGTRYPVEWMYSRRDLPVEIIDEYDTWRQIRDWQGVEGWLHQSMLSSRRMITVTGSKPQKLRSEPEDQASAIAMLEPNVIARLLTCPSPSNFCKIEIENMQGWLRRDEFWGVYKDEYF